MSYVYRDADTAFADLWGRHIDVVCLQGYPRKVDNDLQVSSEELSESSKGRAMFRYRSGMGWIQD
jgi:hypothetical protein